MMHDEKSPGYDGIWNAHRMPTWIADLLVCTPDGDISCCSCDEEHRFSGPSISHRRQIHRHPQPAFGRMHTFSNVELTSAVGGGMANQTEFAVLHRNVEQVPIVTGEMADQSMLSAQRGVPDRRANDFVNYEKGFEEDRGTHQELSDEARSKVKQAKQKVKCQSFVITVLLLLSVFVPSHSHARILSRADRRDGSLVASP
jgi:hypothetical protein